jgi:hypothetical protein
MGAMPVLDGSSDGVPTAVTVAASSEDGAVGTGLEPTTIQGTEGEVGSPDMAPVAASEPAFDSGLFPGWTPEVIQTYLDQGWTLEQLKNWYDQHS